MTAFLTTRVLSAAIIMVAGFTVLAIFTIRHISDSAKKKNGGRHNA